MFQTVECRSWDSFNPLLGEQLPRFQAECALSRGHILICLNESGISILEFPADWQFISERLSLQRLSQVLDCMAFSAVAGKSQSPELGFSNLFLRHFFFLSRSCDEPTPESATDAKVVARFDDVLLLLLLTWFLPVDGLGCFRSGSFSNFRLSFEYVIAPLLAGNRLFVAFTLA